MINFIKSLFCNHKWEKVAENEVVSSYTVDIHIYPFTKKNILLKCDKCGKLTIKTI
jgi:hypothetical protein